MFDAGVILHGEVGSLSFFEVKWLPKLKFIRDQDKCALNIFAFL